MTALTPARIAIRAPNWLGDVVLSLPAVRDVRRAYPNARISMIARPSVAPLYDAATEVDAVLVVEGLSREIGALRRGFDLAILLTNSIGTALAATLAGVPQRWGYSTEGRGFLLTRGAPVPNAVRGRSQVHYYRTMLSALGIPTSEALDTSLTVPSAWKDAGRALIGEGRFFGVAPGAAKGSAKQWPPGRFAKAADRLSDELSARAVLLGSAADAGAAEETTRAMKAPSINLCGKTDLRAFAGVMSCLEAVVANDSGAMHLGAALGLATVGIFGPTNPQETSPLGRKAAFVRGVAECSPCRHSVCPIDHRCMTSVAPETVIETLLREVRS
ncbi:MAG: lipopolysaccharide heptosyltransferase II [Vicinamibacteria bacterium]|nr:lipopolysaccharide heptosyltransferase II [Vicinamibacteria bacterium]